jgi:hypothetical protein
MVSVSLDEAKYRQWENGNEFLNTCKMLQKYTLVGCNLLTNKDMMEEFNLIRMVDRLFDQDLDRVFSLYPKNMQGPDILPKRHHYIYLSTKHPNFYVDDLTYKILEEEKYENWSKPCHYGNGGISINEKGQVSGCSFSDDYKITLERPGDILKINDVCFKDRYFCPYIRR